MGLIVFLFIVYFVCTLMLLNECWERSSGVFLSFFAMLICMCIALAGVVIGKETTILHATDNGYLKYDNKIYLVEEYCDVEIPLYQALKEKLDTKQDTIEE